MFQTQCTTIFFAAIEKTNSFLGTTHPLPKANLFTRVLRGILFKYSRISKVLFLDNYGGIMHTDFIFYGVHPFLLRDIKIIYDFKGVQKGSRFEWTPL